MRHLPTHLPLPHITSKLGAAVYNSTEGRRYKLFSELFLTHPPTGLGFHCAPPVSASSFLDDLDFLELSCLIYNVEIRNPDQPKVGKVV